jgi:hypothetical protein
LPASCAAAKSEGEQQREKVKGVAHGRLRYSDLRHDHFDAHQTSASLCQLWFPRLPRPKRMTQLASRAASSQSQTLADADKLKAVGVSSGFAEDQSAGRNTRIFRNKLTREFAPWRIDSENA